MKKILILSTVCVFICISKCFAQNIKKLDSIHVICYQDDLSGKFHLINEVHRTDFFFNIKWRLHHENREAIIFSHIFPENKDGFWSVSLVNSENFNLFKKIYTLEQFTKELSSADFLRLIVDGKVQLIMLYGQKCSTKFEVYPVKVSTDLSSEG